MVTKIDYNDLSNWGLITEINKRVLHPLGLALTRNVDTGGSDFILIDCVDMEYEYSNDVLFRNSEKFEEFKKHRIEILKKKCSENNNI